MPEAVEILQRELNADDQNRWTPVVGESTQSLVLRLADEGRLSEESIYRLVDEASAVLGGCVPPTQLTGRKTGLICGRVQSGKTLSMTAVTVLARDNGFRVVILLAGTTINLVDQSRARFDEDLRAGNTRFEWVMLKNPRVTQHRGQLESLLQEWRNPHVSIGEPRTLFITVMKHHRHLANLSALLTQFDLSGIPALLFDDEADQASLNTRPLHPIPSTTYSEILALRDCLPQHTVLQYTATPQAPLLISRIDSLSADYAELVSPGESYTGGQTFFQDRREDLVRSIPTSEIYSDGQLPIEPPPSLIRALKVYFLGVAAGHIDGHSARPGAHRSMLVHPSHRQDTHATYFRWCNAIKEYFFGVLAETNSNDQEELLADFRAAYEELSITEPGIPSFEDLRRALPRAIGSALITQVNSRDGSEITWQNAYAHILVGGQKLGRGYTVRGLAVTYMPRNPGTFTADTIQQRARFFGYHADYLGYCRVYLHPFVLRVYVSYLKHEEEMRRQIQDHRGRPLQEWKRFFYLDRRLQPTRRNVLSTPYLRPTLPGGWFECVSPHLAPANGADNWNLVQGVVNSGIEFELDQEHEKHTYAVIPLRDLLENFLVHFRLPAEEDSLALVSVICQIVSITEGNPGAVCQLYLMDALRTRKRTATRRGKLKELPQGRSSAGAAKYPGDRAFHSDGHVTVHIHRLRIAVEEGDTYSDVPAIAIRLPNPESTIVQRHN